MRARGRGGGWPAARRRERCGLHAHASRHHPSRCAHAQWSRAPTTSRSIPSAVMSAPFVVGAAAAILRRSCFSFFLRIIVRKKPAARGRRAAMAPTARLRGLACGSGPVTSRASRGTVTLPQFPMAATRCAACATQRRWPCRRSFQVTRQPPRSAAGPPPSLTE